MTESNPNKAIQDEARSRGHIPVRLANRDHVAIPKGEYALEPKEGHIPMRMRAREWVAVPITEYAMIFNPALRPAVKKRGRPKRSD